MGQIAEDMIDGTSCSSCGVFFRDPNDKKAAYTHGYPVLCWDCWKDLPKKDRKQSGLQRALVGDLD